MKDSKSIKTITKAAIVSMILCACAITPEARLNKAIKLASETPLDQQPALYVELERKGLITSERRETWQKAWEVAQKQIQEDQEEHRRWWASLTPAQKIQYEMQKREQEMQRRQMILQAYQASQQSFEQQQQIDAYNRRTQVLSQPVNINQDVNFRSY